METECPIDDLPDSSSKRQKIDNEVALPKLTLKFDNGYIRQLDELETQHLINASPECIGTHFELDAENDIEIPLKAMGCKKSHLNILLDLVCSLQDHAPGFKSLDDIKNTLDPNHDNIKLRSLDLYYCQMEELAKSQCVLKCITFLKKKLPDIINVITLCNAYNFTLAETILSYTVAFTCIAGKSSTALGALMG